VNATLLTAGASPKKVSKGLEDKQTVGMSQTGLVWNIFSPFGL
jgi:hypothetical protein